MEQKYSTQIQEIASLIKSRYLANIHLKGSPTHTPLLKSEYLSNLIEGDVYLKHEQLQETGSFKYRGAFTKIQTLSKAEKKRGVIAASTGNHGVAVAKAALISHTPATLFLPKNTSKLKQEKILNYGAEIQFVEGSCFEAEMAAKAYAAQHQKTFISPYNDLDVISGQGGIGFEITQDLDDIDSVLISVGGGGLISGIGSFIKAQSTSHQNPKQTEIVGCWPENSPILYECLKAGQVIHVNEQPTLSDATAGNIEENSITLGIAQQTIDQLHLVSETSIQEAMQLCLKHEGLVIEGSAGVAIASLIQNKQAYTHKRVVVVLCGRNIEWSQYLQLIQH